MAKKITIEEEINSNEFEVRLTEDQLVDYWKISKNTLRKWRTTGHGPVYIKIGGRVLYRKKDIDTFERNRLYRSSSEKAKYEEV